MGVFAKLEFLTEYAGSKGIDLATKSIPNLLCRFRAEGPNQGRYFRETSRM